MARSSTAGQLERLCRRYRAVLQPGDRAGSEGRYVRKIDADDGTVRVEARLRPEEAAVVWKAIEAARAVLRGSGRPEGPSAGGDVSAETPPPASAADGLLAVAESFLARGVPDAPVAAPFEVVVHIEADGAAALDDGTPLSADTARRLTCDCAQVRVTETPDGTPLDIGRRTRAIPTPMRRALRLRALRTHPQALRAFPRAPGAAASARAAGTRRPRPRPAPRARRPPGRARPSYRVEVQLG